MVLFISKTNILKNIPRVNVSNYALIRMMIATFTTENTKVVLQRIFQKISAILI